MHHPMESLQHSHYDQYGLHNDIIMEDENENIESVNQT